MDEHSRLQAQAYNAQWEGMTIEAISGRVNETAAMLTSVDGLTPIHVMDVKNIVNAEFPEIQDRQGMYIVTGMLICKMVERGYNIIWHG